MTYVPPDRDDELLDQTQRLDASITPPPAAPGTAPVDPFAGTTAAPAGNGNAGPPRDRVVFQFIWEGILLLLTLNTLFLVYQEREAVLGGDLTMDALEPHFTSVASLLLIASAFGLTLRLGAVNLAVPAMPVLVFALPGLFIGSSPLTGLAYTAGAAAVLAIVYTVLTVVFRVPSWLSGLALLIVVAGSFTALSRLSRQVGSEEPGSWSDPGALWILVGAVVVSALGGLIGLAPGVRDRFAKVKGAADGTGDREPASVAALLGGTFLALLLGALAGFLPVVFGLVPTDGGVMGMFNVGPAAALTLGPVVFIAVFLAGTSPWGRRGGVLGTTFAAVTVWGLLQVWPALDDSLGEWTGALLAGLLLLGLFVSFGLDRLGRPKEPADPDTSDTVAFPAEIQPFEPPNGGGAPLFESADAR